MKNLSCYIIGDDYLLVECGKFLLQKGCVIRGVLSSYDRAIDWAGHAGIPICQTMEQLKEFISDIEFDYLFSISNKRILPASILNKAKKLPINYHNAPLPKYPGVYATTWAILNNEKEHGVTWHIITEEIDEGDILLQEKFPIRPNDTMLTLNTRCHERALVLFKSLIAGMISGDVQPKRQKSSERYYSFQDKVKNDGLISWNQPAEEIFKLYRALCSYPKINHIGLPVFMLEVDAFIPQTITVTKTASKYTPGTLTALHEQYLQISTTTVDLRIHKILDLDGFKCPIRKLVDKYALRVGSVFKQFDKELGQSLEQFSRDNYKNEIYWVKELQEYYPAQAIVFPKSRRKNPPLVITNTYGLEQELKSGVQILCGDNKMSFDGFLLTVLLSCIYRINGYESFTIGIKSSMADSDVSRNSPFYSNYVPFTVSFDPANKKLKDIWSIITEDLARVKARKSYKRDIYVRFPVLHKESRFLDINVTIVKSRAEITSQCNALTIALLENGDFVFVGSGLECSSTSFKRQVRFITTHINALLWSALKTPEKDLVRLSMLTQQDLSCIENDFHGPTYKDQPTNLIPELFEMQESKSPHKKAIFYEGAEISYSEFNGCVNKIARYLLKNHIKKGQIVAVSVNDTRLLLSCMMALMKIGAIYLPLDPTYPVNQLSFVLEDTQSSLLLTSSNLKDVFSWYDGTCMQLDEVWSSIELESSENVTCNLKHDDTAYIIYTSGSTGKPKGVLVSHGNIANSTLARTKHYCRYIDKKSQKFLLLLPTSFDTSMAGILWPLVIGANLTVFPPDDIKNVNKIVQTIVQQEITNVICVPALYLQILSAASAEQLETLRVTILGGDYWDLKLAKAHKKRAPKANLFNEYGVTEVTIWSTVKLIYNAQTGKCTEISIGWPISNTSIYLLDRYMQPVPVGTEGELFLGGNNVSQGYLNRSDLTKERFVLYKNEFNEVNRLYKSGDICCYLPSKGLSFRGRSDHQVKIRGIRIELPQIEKQLMQFSGLKQCVVIDKEVNEEKRIVAYLVLENNNSVDLAEVRKFLGDHLPKYMIPAFFMVLSYIPLTRNNKLERKLLPMPNVREYIQRSNYVPPKSGTEKKLAKIWSEALNFKPIGLEDNFFDNLGGHSLLVTSMLVHVSESFKTDINMQSFLESPTISNLAEIIDGQHSAIQSDELNFINDAELDVSFCSSLPANKIKTEPHAVFLTGVTGFLGIYLLHDLLTYTKADIYCLIRAKNQNVARKRLKACLKENMLDSSLLQSDRVKILVGDLSLPKLGLSGKKFQHLINEIDFIYHNGALVHHLYDYNTLRAPNVLSIHEILRIATTKKLKKIHYVSTFSTTVEFNKVGKIKESFLYEPVDPALLQSGYARSKWVAERLLTQAKDRGVPVNIYRPTWILGHSGSGVSPIKRNHLLQVIKGCIQMGYAPDWDVDLNIMPVDFVSEAITKFSLYNIDESQVFNLQNRKSVNWKDLMTWVNNHYYPVQILANNAWQNEHLALIGPDNMLYPLLSFYLQSGAEIPSFKMYIEDNNVQAKMGKCSIVFPSPNEYLLAKYFDYFQSIGFISRVQAEHGRTYQQLEVADNGDIDNEIISDEFVTQTG